MLYNASATLSVVWAGLFRTGALFHIRTTHLTILLFDFNAISATKWNAYPIPRAFILVNLHA